MGQMLARSAERLRLGLGDRLGEQRDAARALQLRARRRLGARTAAAPSGPRSSSTSSLTDPGDIVDAVAGGPRRRRTISTTAEQDRRCIDYLTDDGANPTLDLNDYDTRNLKLNGLFALVLQSPAYQLH